MHLNDYYWILWVLGSHQRSPQGVFAGGNGSPWFLLLNKHRIKEAFVRLPSQGGLRLCPLPGTILPSPCPVLPWKVSTPSGNETYRQPLFSDVFLVLPPLRCHKRALQHIGGTRAGSTHVPPAVWDLDLGPKIVHYPPESCRWCCTYFPTGN